MKLINKNEKKSELKKIAKNISHYKNKIKNKEDIYKNIIVIGNLYNNILSYKKALNYYEKALQINAVDSSVYYLKANIYLDTKEYEKAINNYVICINLNQENIEALCNMGIAYYFIGEFKKSIDCLDQVILKNNKVVEAYYNRGNAKQSINKYMDACQDYEHAIFLNNKEAEFYFAKANALQELHKFEKAIENYNRSIKLKPDHIEANLNKSLTLLMMKKYTEGFKLYEIRLKKIKIKRKIEKNKKNWDGRDSIKNKKLFIANEQGLGDFIQFVRLIKIVKKLGCEVLLETPKSLVNIVKTVEGVDQIILEDEVTPDYDYFCHLLSLPLALKIKYESIPNTIPYIYLEDSKLKKWENIILKKNKKRIGLVWKGSEIKEMEINKNLVTRKLNINELIEILPDKFEYFSLQKEVNKDEKLILANYDINDHMDKIEDFSDTACLCKCMDIIISIDTSVAHLSGALGFETLLLLPYHADWRWGTNEDNSKWYPTIKIIRQDEERIWDPVLKKLKVILDNY